MHEKMKMMNMNTSRRPSLQIINTSTDVDCTKDVRFRRSFRSLIECMVPACCAFPTTLHDHPHHPNPNPITSTTTVTATFFGHRRGHVSFCIQDHHHPHHPLLLLLEFSIPTTILAREMQHGLLRVALECDGPAKPSASGGGAGLFDVPVWALYCNGKKAGFAVRRHVSEGDWRVLKMMKSVSVGAGVIPGEEEEMMYLRARFERVVGSVDSESFHMINPVGSSGQELSVFFMRS
ncbi:hypothetical protein QJS10_CPA10g00028 [Acorus calamus]|uniref:Protein MIZU-KUSSEI 1-like n=1 Tax=Acorus calamus TaxID=4465 RepID=A0AAV9DZS2_ACOCL|nr:hypothetical protein QJS10_CPA10g00028 [Acorus calamus]